ncbi:hypothetical protein M433DRAFT_4630 [Acidomyces richmondensis BFW]|nr:MAG: hypothetical protein FE78DRAFT_99584 [Acidomyces sp. 'richmondensis']KYG45393.1 hypothetical protein M433DRAFT_4630 [Acidomyces richmondensis BFW]
MASFSTPSLIRPIANRAVHLRITPRPSNIGESREILRLLSQFGEVEHFRNLKYDAFPVPNTMLLIFRDIEAAQHCLERSPIRFRMHRARVNAASHNPEPTNSRIFQIISNSCSRSFRDQLNASHFHGSFEVDTKSAAQQDLAKKVPVIGLSDVNWRAVDKPWHVVQVEKEKDGAFRASGKRKTLMEVYKEAHEMDN